MKNNRRIRIWGFLISLLALITSSVYAVNGATTPSLSLLGDSSISPGATVRYNVVINSSGSGDIITGFSSSINYDSTVLNLSSIEPANGWSGTNIGVSSGSQISFNYARGGFSPGRMVVATLVFKVKSNANASSASVSLKAPSYTKQTDETDTTETGTFSDLNLNLRVKSSDNTLSALKVNGTSVKNFDSGVFEYDVDVDGDTSTARISATANSPKATLKSGSGNRSVSLDYGNNVVKVTVISESGAEQTYTLNITREDTRSTDATLSAITIDGEEIPDFKSDTYNYKLKKYKATKIVVEGVANDTKSTVKVNEPASIIVGENTYTIVVTSEKGDTSTYTVVIDNIEKEINKKLKTLSIRGYDIDFDRNNNRYEISYNKDKFKKLHIYFTTIGEEDEVKAVLSPDINNDKKALKDLKVGDEITITVTGIDGESTEYTIVIVKDSRISIFLVLEVFLIIVIIIVIIVIAIRRKKAKENKGKNNGKTKKNNPNNYKTTRVAKEVVEEDEEPEIDDEGAVPIVKNKKPKRRRFSIYEDEYEEVEIEVDDDEEAEEDDEYSTTKELSTEELNLK